MNFFDKFTGVVQLDPPGTAGAQRIPLEANNILLRGCVLRNVGHIYGIIVYTGSETKVRVKQQVRSTKTASVESIINFNIILLMVLLASTCFVSSIGWVIWTSGTGSDQYYLGDATVTFVGLIEKAFTFFLLNAACIPVSLYVSMKMARTMQKFFMEKDRLMYHEEPALIQSSGGKEGHFPMKVRSMDLNDELGRIGYVFSDKTGTLTLNYMQFRKLVVSGVCYGLGTTQIGRDRMRRLGITPPPGADDAESDDDDTPLLRAGGPEAPLDKNGRKMVPHVTFKDGSESHPGRTFFGDLEQQNEHAESMRQFMLHLTLNHTVIPETVRDEDGNVIGQQLSASSPDEEAFVYAGEYFGYKFLQRQGALVQLEIQGSVETFKVLYILAYNQHRKRMSVIVENGRGEIFLYMKGADTVLYDRLRDSMSAAEKQVKVDTAKFLCDWGNDGLRTLVFAYRPVSREEMDGWAERYEAARSNMVELNKRKNKEPNLIDQLMEEMEAGLILQGATANEDRLQPQVPETLALFARAGINLWMLTGDKQETAINIGFATKLLTDEMTQMIYTTDEMSLEKIGELLASKASEARSMSERGVIPSPAWALVINEKALDYTLENCRQDLMAVTRTCKAVICCRARPDQKGRMVALIKEGCPNTRTLAVGDGANDVDMIKEAHVGVGIAGAEGVQAANASDFSIGRFKFLQRLLLVHGRWNYRRMSKLVCYMFYKNICIVLTQLLYSFYTGWSGQKFYIELMAQSFNVLYTGLPILYLAVLDRDISAENCLRFPMVYAEGPAGRRLNTRVFWSWVLSAVTEALVLFFVPFAAFTHPDEHGTPYVFQLGLVCFTCAVFSTSLRVGIEHHNHHWAFDLLLFLSTFSIFPSVLVFASWDADGMLGGASAVYGSASFWFVLIISVFLASIRVSIVKIWRRYFVTELRHVVKEAQVITKEYTKLQLWSDEAFSHVLAGTVYDGQLPNTTAGAPKSGTDDSARNEAWVSTKDDKATAQRRPAPLLGSSSDQGVRSPPPASLSSPAMISHAHWGEVEAKAGGRMPSLHNESAHALWTKLRAANKIVAFNHMYTGHCYSEDPSSTARLISRMAAGHSRLRAHMTAPPALWEKNGVSSKSRNADLSNSFGH